MNMRKIIAVLAAVLMLCSVIPMSVFAADGDVVISLNFDDGNKKFDKGDIVAEGPDGSNCYKWTATGGWSATYMVVPGMDSSKNYTITMKAKASVAGKMGTTIQNGDWGSYWNGPAFSVTTEWQDIVIEIPAGTYPFAAGNILFKFQDTGVAMDLYIDDFAITEGLPKKPLCENGDFETGDKTGWSGNSKLNIEAAAAHSGNYGAHLIGTGDWGGMMERTFDTEVGKNYELSFWIKTNAAGTNIQLKENTWQGANVAGAGGWFNKTEWTYISYTFTATTAKTYLNFCGANMGTIEDLYVDDVKLLEIKDPSYDGYIYNGDFETGKSDSWTNLWGSNAVEIVEGRDGGYALKATASGAYNIVYQEVAVTPNTNYTVWAYTKDASGSNLWIKNAGGNGDITNKAFASGEWALTSVSFNSGSNEKVWIGLMGLNAGSTYIVDDVFMFEAKPQSNDGYIKNGTFETGTISPWENLWGSCPTAEIMKGGKDDTFALNLVSGKWKHFRQTNIAVEANTDYKISLWSKNVKNMSLLIKDNADTTNIVNKGIADSDDWALTEVTFNSGSYTSILISLMGGAEEAYGQFDNIVMEKLHTCAHVETSRTDATCGADGSVTYTCSCGDSYTETLPATGEHVYFDDCSAICEACGYEREVSHNIVHVEAKAATCTAIGNIEYWYCDVCGMAWLDEACTMNTNLRAVNLPMAEHTYGHDFDVDCDVCSAPREVSSEAAIVYGGGSAMDMEAGTSGLAFLFSLNASGAEKWEHTQNTYLSESGAVIINGEEYVLHSAGAVISNVADIAADKLTITAAQQNGKNIIYVGMKYLWDLKDNYISYAIRVTNIPAEGWDTVVSARPYYTYINDEGNTVTIYGDMVTSAVNEALAN